MESLICPGCNKTVTFILEEWAGYPTPLYCTNCYTQIAENGKELEKLVTTPSVNKVMEI